MTTAKIKCGMFCPRKGYFFPDYEDNRSADMIRPNQLRQLTDYILSQHNDSDEEKADKIEALSELTQVEATDVLYEISRWQ